jgi:hypothetical protein
MTKGCTFFVQGVGMCAGDETYGALKKVLGDMIRMGSSADTVTVPHAGTLDVRWRLCSDHKLVALVAGMGGSGCNKPCFLCNWDRSTPCAVAEERSEDALRQISGWAETFLSPIVDAETQVKRTMTGIKSSAGKGRKGGRGGEDRRQMTAEQAAEIAAAKNARARAVKIFSDQLAKDSDLALAHV